MRLEIDYKNPQFWLWLTVTWAIVSAPFLLVLDHPNVALVGWIAASALFLGSILLFGDGSMIEMGVAVFILAALIVMSVCMVSAMRRRSQDAGTPGPPLAAERGR